MIEKLIDIRPTVSYSEEELLREIRRIALVRWEDDDRPDELRQTMFQKTMSDLIDLIDSGATLAEFAKEFSYELNMLPDNMFAYALSLLNNDEEIERMRLLLADRISWKTEPLFQAREVYTTGRSKVEGTIYRITYSRFNKTRY